MPRVLIWVLQQWEPDHYRSPGRHEDLDQQNSRRPCAARDTKPRNSRIRWKVQTVVMLSPRIRSTAVTVARARKPGWRHRPAPKGVPHRCDG
jgi:hypothetical protein